jgi:hypothetical protein
MRLQVVLVIPFIFASILVLLAPSACSSSSTSTIIFSIHRSTTSRSKRTCNVTIDKEDINISSSLVHLCPDSTSIHKIMIVRGGSTNQPVSSINSSLQHLSKDNRVQVDDKKWSLRGILLKNLLGVWGVMQVVSILSNAIKRLYPIAIQPIIQQDLSPYHWAMYVTWSLVMLYNEGYKAFQLKFSPLGRFTMLLNTYRFRWVVFALLI